MLLPTTTCITHAVKPATEVDGDEAHYTWHVFRTSKHMTTVHQKMAPAMQRTSQADIQWWMRGQVEFSCWFIFTPTQKAAQCIPDKKDAKWVSSLSSSGLQTLPFMWQASQLTWLLLYTGLFTLIYCSNLPGMPTGPTFHGHCAFKHS